MKKLLVVVPLLTVCLLSCKVPPVSPDGGGATSDAGRPLTACEIRWVEACLNATGHGMGAVYPDGCGYGPASAYCASRDQ